jgi:hypothetical protein
VRLSRAEIESYRGKGEEVATGGILDDRHESGISIFSIREGIALDTILFGEFLESRSISLLLR